MLSRVSVVVVLYLTSLAGSYSCLANLPFMNVTRLPHNFDQFTVVFDPVERFVCIVLYAAQSLEHAFSFTIINGIQKNNMAHLSIGW